MITNFDKSFYTQNRQKLNTNIEADSLVILFPSEQFPKNGDQYFKYRQNSDLFYYTGLIQEQTIAVFHKDGISNTITEYAFIIEPEEKIILWTGHKYSKTEASLISGIENIKFISQFDETILSLATKVKQIYYSHKSNIRGINYENKISKDIIQKIQSQNKHIYFQDLDPITYKLRLQKSETEISVIKKAINITGNAFNEILQFVKPGVFEYQVEAEILRSTITQGAQDMAYSPIIASGTNNCILHYNTNRNICKDGDLLLLDIGAELDYYAADLSRTIPVSGKFNQRQKDVYTSVLKVLKQMKQRIVPGTTINHLNAECETLIELELLSLGLLNESEIKNQNPEKPAFKKYFMHGLSHFIGLDVHDTGKKDTILLPGMVLSCEPAIYIAEEGFGIRLENDILVADNPIDLCSHIPIEIKDIEISMK